MRDVNDVGFSLVLGARDWASRFGVPSWDGGLDDAARAGAEDVTSGAAVVYDVEQQSATLRPLLSRFAASASASRLSPDGRRGAARDRYGSWYWIDDARTGIRVRNAGDGTVETFWPGEDDPFASPSPEEASVFHPKPAAPDPAPRSLRGLTITTRHFLVVGASAPNALLVFDLHGSGPPVEIAWTASETFAPVDLAARPGGGIWILDHPGGEAPRLWGLDCYFRLVTRVEPGTQTSDFQPKTEGAGAQVRPTAPDLTWAAALSDVTKPVSLVALPDDTVLVLDAPEAAPSVVARFDYDVPLGSVDLNDRLKQALPPESEGAFDDWQALDAAFVAGTPSPVEAVRGTLYVTGEGGDQAYAFRLSAADDRLTLSLRNRYIPLRQFGGTGLVEADGQVYYDLDDRWIPLAEQPRPRFVERGVIASQEPLDSGQPDTVWHRLFLDACIPPGTRVRVESRASNDASLLSATAWQSEPDPYLRDTGAEVPAYTPYRSRERRREGTGTWELLLQRAEGRYLELRLTLEGTGRATPRLYAARVYAPRFSYLDYLPDVYKQDEVSARFVDRYLANAEGTFTALEGQVATAQTLFDTRTVPEDYLDWLATWFGAELDPVFDERRQRLFLDYAVDLFNQRGTPAGLVRILELSLDECADASLFEPGAIAAAVGRPFDADPDASVRRFGVRIVEDYATRSLPAASVGDATLPEGPTRVQLDGRWTLAEGGDALHERFRQFLRQRYGLAGAQEGMQQGPQNAGPWGRVDALRFPPLLPGGPDDAARAQRREDWRTFVRQQIDGPYAEIDPGTVRSVVGEGADEVTLRYRTFLRQRYKRSEALAPVEVRQLETAPGASVASGFDAVVLPQRFPETSTGVRDWVHFAAIVLPTKRTAHRFRVLVPTDLDAPLSEQSQRLGLARRIVDREKPAHTQFEVRPYWALFQVGTARAGIDTLLGEGSRYAALVLGEGALAQSTLVPAHPEDVPDRFVSGRDRPADARPL